MRRAAKLSGEHAKEQTVVTALQLAHAIVGFEAGYRQGLLDAAKWLEEEESEPTMARDVLALADKEEPNKETP